MSRPLQSVENSGAPSFVKWFVGLFARHLMLDIMEANGTEELIEGWRFDKQLGARILTDPQEIAEEKGTRSTKVGSPTSNVDLAGGPLFHPRNPSLTKPEGAPLFATESCGRFSREIR